MELYQKGSRPILRMTPAMETWREILSRLKQLLIWKEVKSVKKWIQNHKTAICIAFTTAGSFMAGCLYEHVKNMHGDKEIIREMKKLQDMQIDDMMESHPDMMKNARESVITTVVFNDGTRFGCYDVFKDKP